MKALYRRYRPMKLSEVIGQDQVVKPLENSLKAGGVSHAYLFIGPRGCGKTSVARIFAHEVNGFKYELEDDYVDIVEIDGASNRGIDSIRELREKAAIAPTSGKYKVYIVDEVHMLTKEAFNALLKTLEEPPEHVIFIMATTDAYKVPVTITSRAQTYTFKLADKQVMFDFLKSVAEQEKFKITDEALEIIVKRGGGSFRDSLSLLDQISTLSDKEITKELVVSAMGLPEDEKINELLDTYTAGDVVKITTILKELLSTGVKPETLAEEMATTIVDNPKPELLPLLAKLPEIKEPFAEARLLVALCSRASKPIFPSAGLEFSGTSYAGQQAEPPAKQANLSVSSGIYVPKNSNHFMLQEKQVLDAPSKPTKATPKGSADAAASKAPAVSAAATASNGASFAWDAYMQKVEGLNEVLFKQLQHCKYEVRGGYLHLYPRTKIIRSILENKNNKQILVDQAGMGVQVHEPGEKPESAPKDATLDKISDIMGGEVINDNGGNDPF